MADSHLEAGSIQAIDRGSVHRICSGQVVLTLATAVKELVENSIDAGATTIDIRLKEYGSELIEVVDNGSGVEEKNYQGLTLKHHTSKLQEFSDLVNVETFGFRGEALSSLSALGNLAITTCHEKSLVGAKLEYDHDGRLTHKNPCARQKGTTISLSQLFYTLPVRHKEFLKNLKKEFIKMTHVLNAYGIISTGVRITCTNQIGKGKKNMVVSTVGNNNIKDNITNLFGAKQMSSLIEFQQLPPGSTVCEEFNIKQPDRSEMFNINGFISKCDHGLGRSSSDRQFFFINRRPCDLVKVSKIVNEVYHVYNRHQYPCVILDISLEKEYVDVNVTPDKRQIFIQEEKLLLATIKNSLVEMFNPTTSSYQVQNQQTLKFQKLQSSPQKVLGGQKSSVSSMLASMKRSFSSAFAKDVQETVLEKKEKTSKQRKLDSLLLSPEQRVPAQYVDTDLPEEPELCCSSEHSQDVKSESDAISVTENESVLMEESIYEMTHVSGLAENTETSDKKSDCYKSLKSKVPVSVENRSSLKIDLGASPMKSKDSDNCSELVLKISPDKKFSSSREKNSDKLMNAQAVPLSQENENKRSVDQYQHEESPDSNVQETSSDSCDTQLPGAINASVTEIQHYELTDEDNETSSLSVRMSENYQMLSDSCTSLRGDTALKMKEIGDSVSGKLVHLHSTESLQENSDVKVTFSELDEKCDVQKKGTIIDFSMDRLRKKLKDNLFRKDSTKLNRKGFRAKIAPSDNQTAEDELRKEISKDMFSKMEILGQFNLGFLIVKLEQDLFIVDQHATDEKYNFEQLQKSTIIQNQRLAVPEKLELTAVNEAIIIDNLEIFRANGFEFQIDEEAPPTQRVKLLTKPMSKNWIFGKEDVDELIFMLSDSPNTMCRPSRVRQMFASRACRKSIMIGTALNKAEMKTLITHMGEIEQPWNCPHGRPTMRHLVNLDMLVTDSS